MRGPEWTSRSRIPRRRPGFLQPLRKTKYRPRPEAFRGEWKSIFSGVPPEAVLSLRSCCATSPQIFLCPEAPCRMLSPERLHRRFFRPAPLQGELAPVTEAAARRQRHGIRHQPFDWMQPPFIHVNFRDGIHKPDGVRMAHILKHFMDRSILHHLAGVDDRRLLAGLRHNAKIVCD